MCGIAGEIAFRGQRPDGMALERMVETLKPRGPDGSGTLVRGPVALGHRRLRIIDPSDRSAQPMADEALGLSVVYNGAIYNYPDLRRRLEAEGHRFVSEGDTEVLLRGYAAWGEDVVQHLEGMFAFAVVDHRRNRVVLARDRLGIKPLYVASTGKGVRFASTLPALVAAGGVDTTIDPVALHHYLSFHSVVPAPRTILRGVKKVKPGCVCVYGFDGLVSERSFFDLTYSHGAEDSVSPEEWEARVEDALVTAARRRLVADVPVGVLLSGGLDSSLIVALLSKLGQSGLNTFSIGFESEGGEEGNEFFYSDRVAEEFGTRHHRISVSSSELLAALEPSIAAMSEPMVSHDNVGFFLLSAEVARHVKVVQSGQGADEVFAGYHWYPPLRDAGVDPVATYRRHFFDRDDEEIAALVEPELHTSGASAEFVREQFARAEAEHPLHKALRLDTTVMLVEDPVKRVDNMTMAHGLEARVPFLDSDVVQLAARVPPELLLEQGGKGVLKRVARRLLPSEVIDRPKGYFPVPALKHLRGPFLSRVRGVLSDSRARQRGLFRKDMLSRIVERPSDELTPLGGSKLWQVALLEDWLQVQGL
ncbi:MAG: N-acetylglutaminylglutamine amidotransferase [Myxococcales bacterium]|nr:N-acetylglutaminylglutamine amidotransferase [Myxococcales bacterium]